jgi:glycosyltransferase involved in cell wall biosynthesis
MKILQVNHQFPPFSRQGSELHCWQLSHSLAASDDVAVFHISEVKKKFPRRLERMEEEGFPVFHGIDGGHYARLADWPNPILKRQFRSVLEQWKPEVVHFHNYLSLGDDLPSMAKQSGAVVVYTLHDYGLICPNHLLWRDDGVLCGKANADFFQDCCPASLRTAKGKKPLIRQHLPPISRWEVFADQQSNPFVRSTLKSLLNVPKWIYGAPKTSSIPEKRVFFQKRTRLIFDAVDLFIGPSRFLTERFVACGMPQEKIETIRYGIRSMKQAVKTQSPDGRVRFGFIGAFHAHKGLEVLMRAFRGLDQHATLHIHGSSFGGPVAESHWKRVTQEAPKGFHFHGEYRNEQLEDILSSLDVVIVPSLWYENSPFTIQEAFQSGTPVITSNIGGMAELVTDGVNGLHFRVADPKDLHRCMRQVVEDPNLLSRLCANLPQLPTLV